MTEEKLKHSQKTKDKISKSMSGKSNPAYKDGRRSIYNILGVKPKPGFVIHHKNGKSSDNRKSNLKVVSNSEHSKLHERNKNTLKKKGRSKVKQGYTAKRLKK